MRPPSSSTSSSSPAAAPARGARDYVVAAAWTLALLAAADVGLGLVFRMPSDPTREPGRLAKYFDFGRSIEGKLRAMVGATDSTSAPSARSGWLDPATWNSPGVTPPPPGKRRVTVYGQSFAFAVGVSLGELDSSLVLRGVGGPASPASHAFALWSADRRMTRSDVCVLGILASSVRGMESMTAATWMFESPYPYTYPRYRVSGDSLQSTGPRLRSLPDLRRALGDPALWGEYVDDLRRNDAYYDPVLFRASVLDRSTIVRLIRRAWGQHLQRTRMASLHGRGGFLETSPSIPLLRQIVRSFTRGVRADGGTPVVLLLQDRPYGDHLERALRGVLDAEQVPYVDSHACAPDDDPRNFVADGHFSSAANRRMALALRDAILPEDVRRGVSAGRPSAEGPIPGGPRLR